MDSKPDGDLNRWIGGLRPPWWVRLRAVLGSPSPVDTQRIEDYLARKELPQAVDDPVRVARVIDRRLTSKKAPAWLTGLLAGFIVSLALLSLILLFAWIAYGASIRYVQQEISQVEQRLDKLGQGIVELKELQIQSQQMLSETISAQGAELDGRVSVLESPYRWEFAGRVLKMDNQPLSGITLRIQVYQQGGWNEVVDCLTTQDGSYHCQYIGAVVQEGVAKSEAKFRLGLPAGWVPETGTWLDKKGAAIVEAGYRWWPGEVYPSGPVMFEDLRLLVLRDVNCTVWLLGKGVPEGIELIFEGGGLTRTFAIQAPSTTVSVSLTTPMADAVEGSFWFSPTLSGTWSLANPTGTQFLEDTTRVTFTAGGPPVLTPTAVVFVGPFPAEMDYTTAEFGGNEEDWIKPKDRSYKYTEQAGLHAGWQMWLLEGTYRLEVIRPTNLDSAFTGTVTCTITLAGPLGEANLAKQQIDIRGGDVVSLSAPYAGWVTIRIRSGPTGAVIGTMRLTRR